MIFLSLVSFLSGDSFALWQALGPRGKRRRGEVLLLGWGRGRARSWHASAQGGGDLQALYACDACDACDECCLVYGGGYASLSEAASRLRSHTPPY